MLMKQLLFEHIDETIRGDEEAIQFIVGFVKNIPAAVLDVEVDPTVAAKQVMNIGIGVYGYGMTASCAFIEYYETAEQQQPSMALYADRVKRSVTVKGSKEEKKFLLSYDVDEHGEVHKTVSFE